MPEVTLSLLRPLPLLAFRFLMMMMPMGSRPSLRGDGTTSTLVVAVVLAASLVACRKSLLGKPTADECPPVAGRALVVESVRLRVVAGSTGAPDGVIDSHAAFVASGYQLEGQPRPVLPEGVAALAEPPPFDFAKHRIAYASTRQNPNVSAVWVVETPTDIVVGLRVEAYCGGAAPPDGLVGVVVPSSSKPVRFARCSTGACDPNVARP